MTDIAVQYNNQNPDKAENNETIFYEKIQDSPPSDEDIALPAAIKASIRKYDRLIARSTYRRPQHLRYIDYS